MFDKSINDYWFRQCLVKQQQVFPNMDLLIMEQTFIQHSWLRKPFDDLVLIYLSFSFIFFNQFF